MTLDHPIFTRWPAQYPDRLQLFSAPTPNGVKIGIMLEERDLTAMFGDDYRRYRDRVWMLLPLRRKAAGHDPLTRDRPARSRP